MSIENDLRKRLTACIKARDLRTANIIRMINTKIMERRTSKGFEGEVDDPLCLEVIAAYRKTLQKATETYKQVGEKGREALADLEFEIEFCSEFLPKQMSTADIEKAVKEVIAEMGVTDKKMAGRVVGAVMKKYKGQVDASAVKPLVESSLS